MLSIGNYGRRAWTPSRPCKFAGGKCFYCLWRRHEDGRFRRSGRDPVSPKHMYVELCGSVNFTDNHSYAAVVESCTSWASSFWTIRAFPEHLGIENICLWRTSRRIFHERFGCIRPEPTSGPYKSVGNARPEQRRRRTTHWPNTTR
jgi:hypothetical protein